MQRSELATKADIAEPRPHYTLAELLAESDYSQPEDREWIDAPAAGGERQRSELATKADIAELRRDLSNDKAELIKWVVGIGVVQAGFIALILALVKT